MDRARLPRNSDLILENGFWTLRWRQDALDPGGVENIHWPEPASIGPATGPNGISEKEAQRLVWKSFLSLLEKNTQAAHSRMTIADFVEHKFIPEHVALKGFSGRAHYQSMLKHVLKPEEVNKMFQAGKKGPVKKLKALPDWPYLSSVPLCDIRPEHVHRLTAAALERGYSSQTVAHIRNVISAIFSHARQAQCFTGENPGSAVRLSKVTRKEAHSLSLVQTREALRAMQYPEKEMMLVVIFTGMSMSEICGLQWKHVNLAETAVYTEEGETIPPRTIAVRNQWYRGGLDRVKSCHIRSVPIPQPLLQILVKLKGREDFTGPDDFVLVSRVGTAVNLANIVERRLRPIGKKLGVPSLSWHVFRRTRKILVEELGNRFEESMAMMVHSGAVKDPGARKHWRCRTHFRQPHKG